MKRLLGCLLVVKVVGCGGPVAELERLGAKIERNGKGEARFLDLYTTKLYTTKVTDDGLA